MPPSASMRQEGNKTLVTEVRIYTINRGMMDAWLAAFNEHIMPTSAKFGITIHAGWVNRPQNEFIWVRSYENAEKLSTYNTSPERAAYANITGPCVAKTEVREVEAVIGNVPAAN